MRLQSLQQAVRSFGQIRDITLINASGLGHLQEGRNAIGAVKECLVDFQGLLAALLVHVEELLEQIDDAVVVAGKEPDQVL